MLVVNITLFLFQEQLYAFRKEKKNSGLFLVYFQSCVSTVK